MARLWTTVAGVLAVSLALSAPAQAQLNTQHVKGSVGLKAGSQPPPGGYVVAPLLFFYSADDVRDRDGNQFPTTANLDASMFRRGVCARHDKEDPGRELWLPGAVSAGR
jgi:hypothetical protein